MSAALRAGEAAVWMAGELRQGSPGTELLGVSIDTRTLGPGELFVAIAGPQHDAHAGAEEQHEEAEQQQRYDAAGHVAAVDQHVAQEERV